MGIQSTIVLTRQDAEERLTLKLLKREEKKMGAFVSIKTNEEIENELDEDFHNFLIKG